jgi:hypothetical protein
MPPAKTSAAIVAKLYIRRGRSYVFGPGKAELLEHIHETGSIAEAAKTMEMSWSRPHAAARNAAARASPQPASKSSASTANSKRRPTPPRNPPPKNSMRCSNKIGGSSLIQEQAPTNYSPIFHHAARPHHSRSRPLRCLEKGFRRCGRHQKSRRRAHVPSPPLRELSQ